MESIFYDLTRPNPATDLSEPTNSDHSSDLSDDEILAAFEETVDGHTDLSGPKLSPNAQPHTTVYPGNQENPNNPLGWTSWPMGEPSKAAKESEKLKNELAREARRDPAPGLSNEEAWNQLVQISPDLDDGLGFGGRPRR